MYVRARTVRDKLTASWKKGIRLEILQHDKVFYNMW